MKNTPLGDLHLQDKCHGFDYQEMKIRFKERRSITKVYQNSQILSISKWFIKRSGGFLVWNFKCKYKKKIQNSNSNWNSRAPWIGWKLVMFRDTWVASSPCLFEHLAFHACVPSLFFSSGRTMYGVFLLWLHYLPHSSQNINMPRNTMHIN